MDARQQVLALVRQAEDSRPATAVQLLEEAIAAADTLRDEPLGYECRMRLVMASNLAWTVDKAIAVYPWCLAYAERHPAEVSLYALLDRYFTVVNMASYRADVSWRQLQALLDDLGDRAERAGWGRGDYWFLQRRFAMEAGRWDEAREAHAKVMRVRHDRWCGGPDYARYEEMCYWFLQGEDARGMTVVERDLADWPDDLTGQLLGGEAVIPLSRLGRWADADRCHRLAYRQLLSDYGYRGHWYRHAWYATLSGRLARGVEIAERHFAEHLEGADARNEFLGWQALAFLMERLRNEGIAQRRLRLPDTFALHRPRGPYDLGALQDHFFAQASRVAAAIDERNGTDCYTRSLADREAWLAIALPAAASPQAKPAGGD